ncbi:hypothetical protein X560_0879 [Listeria fleischmannii 1991]|nr:hypothetical protein [Listeria fleischmannii]KMT60373.1 hypothetical protein X560_0879 [Listeria fleischmannii 1991]
MMSYIKHILVLTIIFGVSLTQLPYTQVKANSIEKKVDSEQTGNLVINGSFEDGFNGWDNAFPEHAQIIEENGNHFLRYTTTPTGFGPITEQRIRNLIPNTLYKLSMESRKQDYIPNGIGIESGSGLENILGERKSVYAPASTKFESSEVVLKSGEDGGLRIFIYMNPEAGDGQADFDNFVLSKVENSK